MANILATKLRSALVPPPGRQRTYALASFINNIGFGLVMPAVALYFTRVIHLSTVQVGLGFTIAGLVAIPAGMLAGDLADRFGPRRVCMWAILLQCVAAMAYLLIRSFPAFVIISSLETIVTTAYFASAGALLRRVAGEGTVSFRSKVRALASLGVSLGILGAGIGVQIGTANAYRALLFANGLSFLFAWILLARLPRFEPLPRPDAGADEGDEAEKGPRWIAVRDKPFVTYTVIAGIMSLNGVILELPLPLWIVGHTHAPRWSVSVTFLINTLLVILLQVRLGDKVQTLGQGGVAMRRAGVVFLVSCSAIGLMAGVPAAVALSLLVGAIVLHTIGEILYSAGSFTFEFALPPEYAQGQYQGLSGTSSGIWSAAAPTILVGLCLSLGVSGWIGLGACLFLIGLAAPAVATWAERTRPAPAEETVDAPAELTLVDAD